MKKPYQKKKKKKLYTDPIHIHSRICKLIYSDRKQIVCGLGIGTREGEGRKDNKGRMGKLLKVMAMYTRLTVVMILQICICKSKRCKLYFNYVQLIECQLYRN